MQIVKGLPFIGCGAVHNATYDVAPKESRISE